MKKSLNNTMSKTRQDICDSFILIDYCKVYTIIYCTARKYVCVELQNKVPEATVRNFASDCHSSEVQHFVSALCLGILSRKFEPTWTESPKK